MQYSEGKLGRAFALRLEQGERMPEVLETFAAEHEVRSGIAVMVGGAEDGSRLVVGPEDGSARPVTPVLTTLCGAHEVAAVGTLFPDRQGRPILHMHAAAGRGEDTVAGCIRAGLVTWQVLEIVLIEITGLAAARLPDEATGFELLQCDESAPRAFSPSG